MTDESNPDTSPSLKGWAYPPRQSSRVEATIMTRAALTSETTRRDELILDVLDAQDHVIAHACLSKVIIDPPLGAAPRKMTFPDGLVFETDDHVTVNQLTGRTSGSVLHQLERFSPRLGMFVLACIGAAWLLWRFGLDLLVAAAIAITSPVVVAQIYRGTMQSIDLTMAEETTLEPARQKEIQEILIRLVTRLEPDDIDAFDFKLLFRSMPDIGPNAFALPNGTVIITDEFVERFGHDDIIAGVLGHEIGHVVEKHGLRQTYRSLGIYVLVAFLVGDTGPIIEDILFEGNLLASLAYSREHERSADQFGLQLAKDAGYDPAGLKSFFNWASKSEGGAPNWLSSHPSSAERVKEIDAFIGNLDHGTEP